MNKSRIIVGLDHKGCTIYIVQKKFLWWWKTVSTRYIRHFALADAKCIEEGIDW